MIKILNHVSALVTFVYNYDLGRKELFDDAKLLLSSIHKKKKKRQ